ncbi:MAG: metal ABC transporter ATP-binding protein [Candidatus Harrisonbacteria bacterium]|nr:metal ABC transporter ATP-binding protein [Candidatus Harrisonbacteria bacterium]
MTVPILSVKNLNVRFDSKSIIENLSFDIQKGEVMAIIGPNGAGKTVLFRALLGLIPSDGRIEWPKNIKIGYVPQKLAVDEDLPLSVMEFLRFKGASDEEIYEALEAVGFLKGHDFLRSRLGNVSGGEFQRIMIAYALINHPDILLFDEPTAGVDIGGEETIYSLLERLHQKENLTILLITHDLNIIYRYAKKALCLNREKVCFGVPKEVLSPEILEKLYGAKIGVYEHNGEHTH